MINRERMVAEFCELVQIDSLSWREGAMAAAVIEKLRSLGLEVEVDDAGKAVGGETGNVIARLAPARVRAHDERLPWIMLNAHVDTVVPGEGIKPVVVGDKITAESETITGADDKAGVAVIFEAVRQIIDGGIAHGGIEVVFTVAEEIGLCGAKEMDFSRLRSKMAYVMDGGEEHGTITVAAPYANRMKFVMHGKASHAGVAPEKGVNSIVAAARAIAEMTLGRIDDESTANVGVIHGGQATNIIPDLCTVDAEARSHDEGKLEAQTARMVGAMKAGAESIGATVEVEVERQYNGFRIGPDEPIVRLATEAAEGMGVEVSLQVGGGGSDANIFNELGLAAVILSTGGASVHTTAEYASIPTMVHAAEWLVAIVERIGDGE